MANGQAASQPEVISGRSFSPGDLRLAERLPGISAFLRIRSGADFLEPTIESHLPHFDEIVAVYNNCTDATPDILLRLRQKHGHRVRVLHYVDRVFPPGSTGHATTHASAPASFVNYTNIALAETRHRIVAKIDDDHLAIPDALARLVARLRADPTSNRMECFSGLNLMRNPTTGMLGICDSVPISGMGDVGFFHVTPSTYFVHDRRFEVFRTMGLMRRFAGFVYWHLKYLKTGNGFQNYELKENLQSRYHKQLARFAASQVITLPDLCARLDRGRFALSLFAPFSDRHALRLAQANALIAGAPEEELGEAEGRLAAFQG